MHRYIVWGVNFIFKVTQALWNARFDQNRISEGDFLNRTMEQWILVNFYIWASSRGNMSSFGIFNNTGTDQPAHPRSLILNRTMDSGQIFIYGLVARKPVFGFFYNTVWSAPLLFTIWKVTYVKFQFSVAEETGLKPVLSETPKTGFRTRRPKLLLFYCSTI